MSTNSTRTKRPDKLTRSKTAETSATDRAYVHYKRVHTAGKKKNVLITGKIA